MKLAWPLTPKSRAPSQATSAEPCHKSSPFQAPLPVQNVRLFLCFQRFLCCRTDCRRYDQGDPRAAQAATDTLKQLTAATKGLKAPKKKVKGASATPRKTSDGQRKWQAFQKFVWAMLKEDNPTTAFKEAMKAAGPRWEKGEPNSSDDKEAFEAWLLENPIPSAEEAAEARTVKAKEAEEVKAQKKAERDAKKAETTKAKATKAKAAKAAPKKKAAASDSESESESEAETAAAAAKPKTPAKKVPTAKAAPGAPKKAAPAPKKKAAAAAAAASDSESGSGSGSGSGSDSD